MFHIWLESDPSYYWIFNLVFDLVDLEVLREAFVSDVECFGGHQKDMADYLGQIKVEENVAIAGSYTSYT